MCMSVSELRVCSVVCVSVSVKPVSVGKALIVTRCIINHYNTISLSTIFKLVLIIYKEIRNKTC